MKINPAIKPTPPMSNSQLPTSVQERIKADAEKAFPIPVKFTDQVACMLRRDGYITGAAAMAERANGMYAMLVLLRQYHYEAKEGRELNHDAIIGKIEAHLQQWKEGKEVGDGT